MNIAIRLLCLLAAAGITQAATEEVIRSFSNFPHGANPYAPLSRDASGSLYGTTYQGGQFNYGVVFRLSPSGTHTVLYSFTDGADGGYPYGGVIGSAAGYIYGTTTWGGSANLGWFSRSTPPATRRCCTVLRGGTTEPAHTPE